MNRYLILAHANLIGAVADPRVVRKIGLLALLAFGLLLLLVLPDIALAQTGDGMAWENFLCRVMRSLSGPVATAVAVVAIVLAGLGFAFGDNDMFKFLMSVIIGVGIAVSAVPILQNFGVTMGCGIGPSR